MDENDKWLLVKIKIHVYKKISIIYAGILLSRKCKINYANMQHNHVNMKLSNVSMQLFVCSFVWVFSSHSRIFHSYGNVTICGEGLQILTYARPSWPLRSEGSLACHIFCDTGQLFIMVIAEDPWHYSHLLPTI